jgi:hypothetical protein
MVILARAILLQTHMPNKALFSQVSRRHRRLLQQDNMNMRAERRRRGDMRLKLTTSVPELIQH